MSFSVLRAICLKSSIMIGLVVRAYQTNKLTIRFITLVRMRICDIIDTHQVNNYLSKAMRKDETECKKNESPSLSNVSQEISLLS